MYELIKRNWPWLILAAAIIILHSQHQLDSDEGVTLNAAWNILHGKILYTDFFEFIPPLAPLLVAAWWRMSEASFLSAAILGWIISFACVVALYLLSIRIGVKRWKHLAGASFIILSAFWPMINHNLFSLAAAIWALYFLCLPFRVRNLIIAGLLSAASLLCLQHKGLALLTATSLWFVWLINIKKIRISYYIYYLIALSLPVALTFLVWSPRILWQNLVIFPVQQYPETNMVSPALFVASTLASLILAAVGFLHNNPKTRDTRILLALGGVALLASTWPRADAAHVFQAVVPLLPLIALSLELSLTKRYDVIIFSLCGLVAFIALTPRPLFDSATTHRFINHIKETCPVGKIYAGPFMPGIYFELRTLNPVPYSILITHQQSEAQFIDTAERLAADPPACVVVNYHAVEKFSYDRNNLVENFLKEAYREKEQIGRVHILIKK